MESQSLDQRLDRIEKLLLANKTVLTVEELADYTGIAVSQIYKFTSSQKIPFSKPGGKKVYFDKEKIDQWLLRNPVKTEEEIEQEALNFIINKRTRL